MTHSKCEVGIAEGAWLGSLLSSRGNRRRSICSTQNAISLSSLAIFFPRLYILEATAKIGRWGKKWQGMAKREQEPILSTWWARIVREGDVEEWEWGAHLNRSWRAERRNSHASATATCVIQPNSFRFLDENGNFSLVVVSHKLWVTLFDPFHISSLQQNHGWLWGVVNLWVMDVTSLITVQPSEPRIKTIGSREAVIERCKFLYKASA